jgi:hypothetical protein
VRLSGENGFGDRKTISGPSGMPGSGKRREGDTGTTRDCQDMNRPSNHLSVAPLDLVTGFLPPFECFSGLVREEILSHRKKSFQIGVQREEGS